VGKSGSFHGEETFYLFFPLVRFLIRDTRLIAGFCIAGFSRRPFCSISCRTNGPDIRLFLLFRPDCAWLLDRDLFSADPAMV
jgi:hypothetical protein